MGGSTRRGGRPTVEEARTLTSEILAAATRLFLSIGYQDTTFERVAQEAGTSKGALYARYPDKAALFAQVCSDVVTRTFMGDIVEYDDDLPVTDSLRRVAIAILSAATQPPAVAMYHLMTESAFRHPEISRSIAAVWDWYVEQIDRYFRHRVARGRLALRDTTQAARTFAYMIFSPIHVALVHHTEVPSPEEQAAHVERALLVFLGGIGRLEIEGV